MNRNARLMKPLTFAALLLSAAAAHAAGNPVAGHEKVRACAECHGLDGKGRIPLAGMQADYLEGQLRAFQSGVRREPVMNMIAKSLSAQDIADLAAYFAA